MKLSKKTGIAAVMLLTAVLLTVAGVFLNQRGQKEWEQKTEKNY